MLFFKNLKGIIENLPLILSDSTDPKDVSFTRISGFILILFLIYVYCYALLVVPQYLDKINSFITSAFNALLLFIGANIVKKGVKVAEGYISTLSVKKEGEETK